MMVMVVTTTLTKLMMIHDNAKEEEMKSAKPQKESRRWDAPALCEKRLQAPKIGAEMVVYWRIGMMITTIYK